MAVEPLSKPVSSTNPHGIELLASLRLPASSAVAPLELASYMVDALPRVVSFSSCSSSMATEYMCAPPSDGVAVRRGSR